MENFIEYLGYVAGFCTTIAFLPQVIKIWQTKSVKDISVLMYLIFVIGVSLWIIYGLIHNAWPIIISNCVTLLLTIVILIMKAAWKDL